MTTTNELHPIWTDGGVMQSLHAMYSVLGEWEQLSAEDEATVRPMRDVDAMTDVEDRFTMAVGDFFAGMEQFRRRNRKQ
jgi:hypothetical protein